MPLAFPVLSNLGNTVARRYRLVFSVPDATRLIYQQQFGIDLPAFNGDDSWELPIPGTFLLDQQAKVRLAFVDVDYTHRLEPSALLQGLRGADQNQPHLWVVTMGVQFTTTDQHYQWLNSTLGVVVSEFDERTGHALWHAFVPPVDGSARPRERVL